MLNLWHNYRVLAVLPQERDGEIDEKIKTEMRENGKWERVDKGRR